MASTKASTCIVKYLDDIWSISSVSCGGEYLLRIITSLLHLTHKYTRSQSLLSFSLDNLTERSMLKYIKVEIKNHQSKDHIIT